MTGTDPETLRIGIAAVQGAVTEHQDAVQRASQASGLSAVPVPVRTVKDFQETDALIIPGGESTTISRLFERAGLHDEITRRVDEEDYPVMGTCAGMVMLAKQGDSQVTRTRTRQLGLMDFAVQRNAFGRQRESFEHELQVDLPGLDGVKDIQAVFIRAPCASKVWGEARSIAHLDDRVIAVAQGRRIALSFHPELTGDSRVHEAFLRLVAD